MLGSPGIILLAALASGVAPPSAPESAAALRAELRVIRTAEAARLRALAAGLAPAEAEDVLGRIEPEPPADGSTRFLPLPEVVPASDPPPKGAAPRGRKEALACADKAAAALFDLADAAAKIGRFALADECLRGVIARKGDHAEARRLLGFVPHAGGWATPYAVNRLRDGWVLHRVFGWVPAGWVPHLDRGELPGHIEAGRPVTWLPAAEADALHAEFAEAWTIETAHFHIRSNVPLSELIIFARRLEDLDDVFFALLADVIGPDLPLARRYRSPAPPKAPARRHRVWYFSSKTEYVAYLRPKHGPGVEAELGRYDYATKPGAWGTSYFYRDPGAPIAATATLHHEASHQLLFESAGRRAFEANAGNFWVFEGLGTYFETLTPQPDGSLQIGGLVGPRVAKARANILDDGDYLPIADLAAFDQAAFNAEHAVYRHYAESMALAIFLMHADGARYREPFLDYTRDAYRGLLRRGVGRSLADHLGVPYARLDRQFLAFLRGEVRAKPEH